MRVFHKWGIPPKCLLHHGKKNDENMECSELSPWYFAKPPYFSWIKNRHIFFQKGRSWDYGGFSGPSHVGFPQSFFFRHVSWFTLIHVDSMWAWSWWLHSLSWPVRRLWFNGWEWNIYHQHWWKDMIEENQWTWESTSSTGPFFLASIIHPIIRSARKEHQGGARCASACLRRDHSSSTEMIAADSFCLADHPNRNRTNDGYVSPFFFVEKSFKVWSSDLPIYPNY